MTRPAGLPPGASRPGADHVGALVGPELLAAGALSGPLAGRTFVVEDLLDVAGHRTGAGNPARLEDAAPATAHAPAGCHAGSGCWPGPGTTPPAGGGRYPDASHPG